ncbi:MAG: Gamma-glutamylputrescine oxidoreductase [Stenotrophomonas maltophilia]|nr:MAG: Gamma-glutamylputrescine oxidoreductase [Stenotrophomonas maltophilia]
MSLRQECLWEYLTPERPQAPVLHGERSVDVCVIGAGFTGLSAALHLLREGTRVCVLEAHTTGHGGSGRNVGLVNAGLWIAPDDIEAGLGEDIGQRLNSMLGNAPSLVFSLIDEYAIDCQARREGTLHMAHNARGLDDLRNRCQQWQRRGAPVQLLSGAECAQACGTTRIAGALLDRRAGTLNPMGYVSGLARAVQGLGGELFHHSAVNALQREGERWRVSTAQGSVLAQKVIIASSAYTEGEWTELRRTFFPGYYYQVASRPLEGEAAARILPGGQGSWDTRQVLSSIRRDADGRLLLGSLGKGTGKPEWFLRSWADRIQQHYFPQLGKVDWEFTWTGCIDLTPDHLMRLFEPAPGLLAMSGYNGRGVTTGTVVGKAFADFLLRGDTRALPMPLRPMEDVLACGLRSCLYEAGFSLYHAGQCLRVVI